MPGICCSGWIGHIPKVLWEWSWRIIVSIPARSANVFRVRSVLILILSVTKPTVWNHTVQAWNATTFELGLYQARIEGQQPGIQGRKQRTFTSFPVLAAHKLKGDILREAQSFHPLLPLVPGHLMC